MMRIDGFRSSRIAICALLLNMVLTPLGIASDPVVRIGVYDNPPKIHPGADGRPEGLFADLAREIARHEGWQLEWVACEWLYCMDMLERRQLDLMPDVAFSAERARRIGFHQVAVVQSWSQIYAQPQRQINELAELDGQSVSLLAGSIQQDFFEAFEQDSGIDIDLRLQPTLIDTLNDVAAGTADFGITNHFFGQRHAYDLGLVEMPMTLNQVSLLFAAPEAESPLLARIDDRLAQWKQDRNSPYYRALLNTMAPESKARWPRWALPLLATAAVVVLILVGLVHWMRRRVESTTRELQSSSQRLDRLMDSASVVLYSLDYPSMHVISLTPNFERITGYPLDLAQKPDWWRTVVHPDDIARIRGENDRLRHDRTRTMEYRVRHARGRWLFIRDEKRLIKDPDTGNDIVIGSWSDVTEARRHNEQLDYLSFHDRLTSLPNRARLGWLLDQLLAEAEQHQRACTVMLVDMDRFKALNDALGSQTGDSVLRLMAARLAQWIGPDDVLARFGNDEFCIATNTIEDDLGECIESLFQCINQPVPLSDRELTLTASVGAARFPDHGKNPEELLREAAKALEIARSLGGNASQLFDPEMDRREFHRILLESDLRQAIELDQLQLHYQPQVRLRDSVRNGLEALVRWRHPEMGLLPPARFIPLAEQTGLITEIDRWVMRSVCHQIAAWNSAGQDCGRVAVNLSVRELHDHRLVDHLQECLAESGISPSALVLEVTESRLMQSIERSAEVLRQLYALGVGISIDDFGHGYSNLSYLARLDMSQVKLDRSLILHLEHSARAQTLVRGMIDLFDEMDIEVVAEGIETEGQAAFLRGAGCQIGQGWLFGRPSDPEALRWPTAI